MNGMYDTCSRCGTDLLARLDCDHQMCPACRGDKADELGWRLVRQIDGSWWFEDGCSFGRPADAGEMAIWLELTCVATGPGE